MTQSVVTPLAPSDNEYGIVATFTESTLDSLVEIQTVLKDRLGDAIWITPRQALHSTLMEIICDTDYAYKSRQQLFEDWYAKFNKLTTETIASLSPCSVRYTQLGVSPRAIIVRTDHSEAFNAYRSRLLTNIVLPQGTKMPPDITHCSLARFNAALNLDEIIERTKDIKVDITEHVVRFKLLRDLGPPTFTPNLIELYEMNTKQVSDTV